MIALWCLLVFLGLIFVGMPIFFAMAISGLFGFFVIDGPDMLLTNLALETYSSLDSFILVSVPLYVFAGCLLEVTGLSRRLFDFAEMVFAKSKGGLGVATVFACAIFAAVSGSSVATAATIGLIALPIMADRGYRSEETGALVAAGGTLGILVPPSIPLIIFGLMTEQSIGALFVAGAVPGLLLAFAMAAYTSITSSVQKSDRIYTMKEKMSIFRKSVGILLLPVFVFFGIYTGIATPTEIAALAVAYIVMLGAFTSTLNPQNMVQATMTAMRSSVMIFVLVAFGGIVTKLFTLSGVPQTMVSMISLSGFPPFVIFTLIIVLYLILGMFLEALSMMVITVPMLFPVALALGIPPLAFAIIVVLAVETAQITPPVGINLLSVAKIGNISFPDMAKSVLPYVALLIIFMYLIYFVPQIATWLPSTMKYGD